LSSDLQRVRFNNCDGHRDNHCNNISHNLSNTHCLVDGYFEYDHNHYKHRDQDSNDRLLADKR
jgi:hypothetical protein